MKKINVKKIIKVVNKKDCVSFDIFNTLIRRNVCSPTDVFDIAEKKYNQKTNEKIRGFKNIRIVSEIDARKKHEYGEVTLDDIYNELSPRIKNIDIEVMKKIETECEYNLCVQNIDMRYIYEYCVKNHKKIILISDMYLPKATIESMLKKCGIKTYNYIFISGCEKKNKRYGKLYDYAIQKVGIKKKNVVHIGDSLRNDFIIPSLKLIKAIKIPSVIEKTNYTNKKLIDSNKEYRMLCNYLNNKISLDNNIYYNIGYECLGPILNGYCVWLSNLSKSKKINKVYFLAREGNLIKSAFEIINDKGFDTHYLYLSRKSSRCIALARVKDLDEALAILRLPRFVTLFSFFENVNLPIANYNVLIEKYGYLKDDNIFSLKDFANFFDEIRKDINIINKKKTSDLLMYLKQQKFYGNVIVSDVGWRGTMQEMLDEICASNKIDVSILGLYLGLNRSKLSKRIKNKVEDYLSTTNSKEYNDIRGFLNLFESFFLAQHGTTISYAKNNKGEVTPVLGNYEYTKDKMKVFSDIQKGALDFVNDYNIDNEFMCISTNFIENYANMEMLGNHPRICDIKLFGKISYVENEENGFIEKHNFIKYLASPKQFYKDFSNSRWKIGFLKQVFKIKLNYLKIYKFILKFDKR